MSIKNYAIGWYCHLLLRSASFEIDLGKQKIKTFFFFFFFLKTQKQHCFFGLNHIYLLPTNTTFFYPKIVETNGENPKTLHNFMQNCTQRRKLDAIRVMRNKSSLS
jgi:hypothetical protein